AAPVAASRKAAPRPPTPPPSRSRAGRGPASRRDSADRLHEPRHKLDPGGQAADLDPLLGGVVAAADGSQTIHGRHAAGARPAAVRDPARELVADLQAELAGDSGGERGQPFGVW